MQDMLVSPAKHLEPDGTKAIVADSLLTEQLMPLTRPGVYRICSFSLEYELGSVV
jgi:hypothetical protein